MGYEKWEGIPPAGYGPEGLEIVIRDMHGVDARHVQSWQVTVPGRTPGFVHEFELVGHATANTAYVMMGPGGTPPGVILKSDRVSDPLLAGIFIGAAWLKDGR